MDTYITVTVYGENAEQIVEGAQKSIEDYERLWSVTSPGSEIYKINNSGGKAVVVSDETIELIEFALEMSLETDGALNPAIYPLLSLWGFTKEENYVPSESEINSLLKNVDCSTVKLDDNAVIVPDNIMLDFGSVGKGFVGDKITEQLQHQGIKSALLDIGGNVQAIGTKPDGEAWKIGLRNPMNEGILGVLSVSDLSVVTSGNYERYFVDDNGKRYGHIIDPASGYPVENDLLSVTIIGEKGRQCDALSTALFVMGFDKAIEFFKDNGGFEMILVKNNGEIYATSGVRAIFSTDNEVFFI